MADQLYLPKPQLEDLLVGLNINITGRTRNNIIAFCPFHKNRDTPAFTIAYKGPHKFICNNGKCAKRGNIVTLLSLFGYSWGESRKILKGKVYEVTDFERILRELLEDEEQEINEWAGIDYNRFINADKDEGFPARLYLRGRGITDDRAIHFSVGYSPSKRMLTIPVLDERSILVGIIGRSIDGKRYQYSTGLPRGETIWNIQNARGYDSIILTEGALDGFYVSQADYENVGAIFGSVVTPEQLRLLRKYFNEIICFFDNDDAGYGAAETLMNQATDLTVSVVRYPERMVEIEGELKPVKDPEWLTVEEIKDAIENRVDALHLRLAE